MYGGNRTGTGLIATVALALLGRSLHAAVNLEWRPTVVGATPNQIVEIDLFAVSDTGFDQTFSGLSVLFSWDPLQLELLGFVDPCTQEPCSPETYDWLQSWFPDDSELEGINDSLADGDAFYQALGQLGLKELPVATGAGLHVTTFRFRVLGLGLSEIAFIPEIGVSRTRVAGGELPGLEITGALGPPVQVLSRACDQPVVEAAGGRYLSVTPAAGADPVAIRVRGVAEDPAVSCVDRYVQPDGTLGAAPVYRSPVSWATVFVRGEAIRPSTTYEVEADCAAEAPGLLTSGRTTVVTWRWGDTNGDGLVILIDVTRIVDAAEGSPPGDVPVQALDLSPCIPDGVVDQNDIDAALAALAMQPFGCAAPCLTTRLDQLFDLITCLAGPNIPVDPTCSFFDFDSDGDVDVADFSVFARHFTGSGQ